MGARQVFQGGAALLALLAAVAVLVVLPASPASAAPGNDAFANAQQLTGTFGSVNGTNVLATRESGEPNPFSFVDEGSVWYRWTPANSGTVSFDTCTASYDTTIGVSTGAAVNNLTPVVSNDDSTACGEISDRSRVTFAATAGTTYRIAVAGFTEGGGTFTLAWNQVITPPGNDAFANAQAINGTTGSVNGNNAGATPQSGEPNHAGQATATTSTWYSYAPTSSGTLTVDTCTGTAFDSIIGVYTGDVVNTLTQRGFGDDECGGNARATFAVTTGTTYRIAVAGYQGASGPFTLTWNLVVPAPANDAFASAQTINGASGTVNGTTVGATFQTGELDHAGATQPNGKTVWYQYTPTSNGTLTVGTCTGTSFDSIIGVYTGTAVNSLTERASGDQDCGDGDQARATVTVTTGTPYRIAVAGYHGGAGAFTLSWAFVTTPGNDAIAGPQTINGTTGTANGTTVGATLEASEPDHFPDLLEWRSVWYSYTPATSGTLTLDTCATATDTGIAAYTGTPDDLSTPVASNDNGGGCPGGTVRARVTFAVTSGTTYRIAVVTYPGVEAGATFTLAWNLVPSGPTAPANDALANAQAINGTTGTVNGTTLGATFEGTEPDHFPDLNDSRSVWYSYTPSATGTLTLDTCITGTDTGIAVYAGTPNAASTPAASNDDEGGCPSAPYPARVSFPVTSGTSYRIAIVTFSTVPDGGPFTLRWDLDPSDPGGPTFTDVATSHPFYADIEWMAAEEISTGYQPGPTYRPGSPVTRAAMSAFMYRLAGSPSFTAPGNPTFGDVGTGHPFYAEIEWMAAEDITTGTAASPKPLYKPSAAVSRGAMSAFMYRLAGSPTFSAPGSATFGDVNASHPFYAEIEWMAAEDITTGTPGSPKPTYKPANAVSRGAMSAFMHRLADGPGVDLS
jgi:hypothetical protein